MNKILIISNTAWSVVNFQEGFLRSLIEEGLKVVVVAPSDYSVSKLEEMSCGFLPIQLDRKGTNPLRDFVLLYKLYNLLKRERPDVLITRTVKPNIHGSLAARLLRIPTINVITGLGTPFIKRGWLQMIVSLLHKISLRWSRKVFFLNRDDYELFLELGLVSPKIADLLPSDGINLDRFKPGVFAKEMGGGFRFLFIGRLLWDKGIGEFVEAAKYLRKRYPDVEFCLLGFLDPHNPSAVTHNDLDMWVSEGYVTYLGSADDVRPHITSADCIVLPSYREGVPRSLLEAAAMEKPIITTDSVGCKEVVDDGLNGFLVRPRDAEDLVRKMDEMINLPENERVLMGKRGREKVMRQFDEKLVIEKWLDVLKSDGMMSSGR